MRKCIISKEKSDIIKDVIQWNPLRPKEEQKPIEHVSVFVPMEDDLTMETKIFGDDPSNPYVQSALIKDGKVVAVSEEYNAFFGYKMVKYNGKKYKLKLFAG